MAVCCCSLAGTAACNHCSQNPFATDVWTNNTVTVDHVEDLCGNDAVDATAFAYATKRKPPTNADHLRAMTDDELAELMREITDPVCPPNHGYKYCRDGECRKCWLDWLKEEADG